MNIQVTLWENSSNGSTLARGFVKIEGFVQINISIYSGRNGPFVAFPSYKKQDGTWQETAGPVSKESREAITAAVLSAYNKGSAQTAGNGYNVVEPPQAQYQGQAAARSNDYSNVGNGNIGNANTGHMPTGGIPF
jgi:hypothetical protein